MQNLPMEIRVQQVHALCSRASLIHRHVRWPHELSYVEQDLGKALDLLKDIKSLDPDNVRWRLLEAQVHQHLANAYRDLDVDLFDANEHYKQATVILAGLLHTAGVQAEEQQQSLRLDYALAYIKHGALLDTTTGGHERMRPFLFEVRGELALRQEDCGSAYQHFQDALKSLPENSQSEPNAAWLTIRRAEALFGVDASQRDETVRAALVELEKHYKKSPHAQQRLLRLADALRVLSVIDRENAPIHLKRADDLLSSSGSVSLQTLRLRNRVRVNLAKLSIDRLIASSPAEVFNCVRVSALGYFAIPAPTVPLRVLEKSPELQLLHQQKSFIVRNFRRPRLSYHRLTNWDRPVR